MKQLFFYCGFACSMMVSTMSYSQVTLASQGGEPGDTWTYTSTGASALSISEAAQSSNKVTGTTSLVAGGNTGGGNCFAGGSGNGPSTARTFTFDAVDISGSSMSSRTLVFNWGNRFPVCNGTGWDAGENLVFTAYHDGVAQSPTTLANGNNNAAFSILTNQYTYTIPSCVASFYFVISVTTNRADELLFIDDVKLTAPVLNTPLAQPSPISGNTSVCAGATETYSVTQESGTAYTWSGLPAGASFTSTNGTASAFNISVNWGTAAPGTYTLSVAPTGSCSTSGPAQTLQITVQTSTAPAVISGPTSFCSGTPITLTSSYVSGNTWSTGETTQSISVSAAGTYSVNVTQTCGTTNASQVVTMNALPDPQITGNASYCQGSQTTLTASGGDSYLWSTSETSTSISVNTAGNYIVTATNTCGTATSTPFIVTALPQPNPQIAGNTSFCQDSQTTLTASGGDSYLWSTGETSTSINANAAGNYTVTTTNSCGTATSAPFTVTELPQPNPQIAGNTSFCQGLQTSLTAAGGDTYSWSTGETGTSISVNTAGNYTVTAMNSCGTATSAPFTVTELPQPNPQIAGSTSFCQGSQTTLTASGGDTYSWSTGETGISINVNAAGTYTVTATNLCGTTISAPFTVNQLPLPVAQISGETIFCEGEQSVLTASGGTGYLWSDGQTTASITVSSAGTYTVTAINSCATDDENVVVTISSVAANFTATPLTGNAPLEVSFANESAGDVSNLLWNFGDDNTGTGNAPAHLYATAGSYTATLVAVTPQGCQDSYSLTIEVFELVSSLTVPNVFTPNGDGANDLFIVQASNLTSFKMTILNRWGNVMAELGDPVTGWDGISGGSNAVDGTYFYQVTATGTDNKNYNQSGFFELQR